MRTPRAVAKIKLNTRQTLAEGLWTDAHGIGGERFGGGLRCGKIFPKVVALRCSLVAFGIGQLPRIT